jgi:hypothetical protein
LIVASLLLGGVARRRGLVLVAVVDDLQDLDEAERGAEAAKGRLQLRVDREHVVHDAAAGWRTHDVVTRRGY